MKIHRLARTWGTMWLGVLAAVLSQAATISVTTTADSGAGSLRVAILTANLSVNVPDTIQFNIAGPGPHVITPLTPLPTITDPVTIDGYTQPGTSMNTLVQGNDAVLGIVLVDTLVIATTNSTVRGLAVRQIQLGAVPGTRGGHVIEGNFIGLDASGTNTLGSAGSGVFIQTPTNRIGGATPATRNLISGHGTTGMEIFETFASGNLVQNNYIGTDRTGTKAIGNTDRALVVNANAFGNTILSNLVSGNLDRGITLDGFDNLVRGNNIGTDASGQNPLGNRRTGVEISGPGNTVGGTNNGAANVIAFNGVDGGGIFTTNGVDVAPGATGYAIYGNSIFDNAGLGIDVNANKAVTLGFPVITLASNVITSTILRGTHAPNTLFRLELFLSPGPDPSGYGEGRTLMLSTNINTDAGGNFAINWPTPVPPGTFVTATANGVTEFSQARMVVAAGTMNHWTNSLSGKWEIGPNWSLNVPPYSGHALVTITNAGTKTVTSDTSTTAGFPTAMAVTNLVVSAPGGATNTLLLAGGVQTPLAIRNECTVNSGGQLIIQNGGLIVGGPFGTTFRNDGQIRLEGGLLTVTNGPQLLIGNNGRGSLTVSGGMLTARYPIVGANSGSDGRWTIAGGTNLVIDTMDLGDALTATGTVVMTGGKLVTPGAYVGLFGEGRMFISNGIVECAGNLLVGSQPGARGSFVAAGGNSTFSSMQIRESPSASGSALVTGNALVLVDGPLDNRGNVTVSGGLLTILGQLDSEAPGNSITVTGGQFAATNDNAFLTSVTVSNGAFLARDVFLGNTKTGLFQIHGGIAAAPGSMNGFNVGVNGGTATLIQTGGQLLLTNADLNVGGLFSPALGFLNITNGATHAFNVFIGGQGGGTGIVNVASGNLRATNLYVGYLGPQNRLVATQGARVVSSNTFLGFDAFSSGNTAILTGAGTVWTNRQYLMIGESGRSNHIILSDGAVLNTGFATLGLNTSSSNNTVTVAGPGTLLRIEQNFSVGFLGSGNRLVVTNGAQVDGSGYIGYLSSGNNEVLVSGAGSSWTNGGTLFVGATGPGNRLVISNGGQVVEPYFDVIVGAASSSLNNRLMVDGGTLRVLDSTFGVLDVRRGTNVLNSGLIHARVLLLTNSLGVFEFNGGKLSTSATTNDNGRLFTAGNGVSAATLEFQGGSHLFANSLLVPTNSTLVGTGMVFSAVTNVGTVNPGSSIGQLGIAGSLVLSNNSQLRFEVAGSAPGSQYDQLNIIGPLTQAGSVTVQLTNGFIPSGGQVFQLISASTRAGTFASVTLPVLPVGLTWTNRLAIDGSVGVIGPSRPQLTNPVILGDGNFRFTFTNAPGSSFTVLAATNVALPPNNWTPLGPATQPSPGQYQFTDLTATNFSRRFYRVSTP